MLVTCCFLFFKLNHFVKPAQRNHSRQEPHHFSVSWNIRLDKKSTLIRIYPTSDQSSCCFETQLLNLLLNSKLRHCKCNFIARIDFFVLNVLSYIFLSDCMIVNDAVESIQAFSMLRRVLQVYPVLNCPQIVAKMYESGRLYS